LHSSVFISTTSPPSPCSFLFFYSPADPLALHSFPTRRSSDLQPHRRPARAGQGRARRDHHQRGPRPAPPGGGAAGPVPGQAGDRDRKSTRLNSSHVKISYAVFCLKKKKNRIKMGAKSCASEAV